MTVFLVIDKKYTTEVTEIEQRKQSWNSSVSSMVPLFPLWLIKEKLQ